MCRVDLPEIVRRTGEFGDAAEFFTSSTKVPACESSFFTPGFDGLYFETNSGCINLQFL
jgi:hypothetical protein